MSNEHLVRPGSKVKLREADAEDTGRYRHKDEAEGDLEQTRSELIRLQELLFAEDKHGLLIILQAMDTGGKVGAIRHVMFGVNPQGCAVTSFKTPTQEELDHDYLWRVHKATPAKGMIGIFNRSYYEDVLIVRVHGLVPEKVWRQRYDQINVYERFLSENGTKILKFYLHISKDEQKRRLQERLDEPDKRWKFALTDLDERRRWDEYMRAYEDVLNRTSTEWAPWYLVPANAKWYRNLVVARAAVKGLRDLDMRYPEPKFDPTQVVIPD